MVGVILRIDSPGGSSVQAGDIVDEIRRLRRKHPDKPLHAVIEEMGASAAYYVASAADNIYVNKASTVGSIGVILGRNGVYGVEEAMKKAGHRAPHPDGRQEQGPSRSHRSVHARAEGAPAVHAG